MDKQRAKIIIKKINSLFDSIEMETNELSTIERDLMLKYIRDLYEAFVEESRKIAPTHKEVPPSVTSPKKTAPEAPEPVITSTPMKQPQFDRYRKQDSPAPSQPEVAFPKTREPELVYSAPNTSASGTSPGIEALFTFKEARELSEKLSEQPIRDLQNALSINDILLYTNELFGRQQEVFNNSLKTLNRFENMKQAKSFLVSLAEQYNWGESEREEIARSFIKTIRRRYV